MAPQPHGLSVGVLVSAASRPVLASPITCSLGVAECKRIEFLNKRCFAHYRFHKHVGKGNWNRYIERYSKPREIENTQRLIFNYKASFQAAKNSASYLWELPKRIASATSANQLLDVWVFFRHKKKKLYHYVLALKRLCAIKDVDVSDWRFQLLARKVVARSRYFIDLPNVCLYFGQLKATALLDKLSLRVAERLEYCSADQIAKVASAYAAVSLHSKHLFSLLATRFEAQIFTASNESLVSMAKAMGKCMIYNYKLATEISLQIQMRLHKISIAEHVEAFQVATGAKHCMSNLTVASPNVGIQSLPTLDQMIKLVEAFVDCKYQDLAILNWTSKQLQAYLKKKLTDDDSNNYKDFNPLLITKAIDSFYKLKINDVGLFQTVLEHVAKYPYDYPPMCIANICKALCLVLPSEEAEFNEKFQVCWNHLANYLDILPTSELVNGGAFAYKILPANEKVKALDMICNCVSVNGNGSFHKLYDAPKLLELLSMHGTINDRTFQILCRDVYKIVDEFEPCDYTRTARVMRKLKKQGFTNIKLINMLAKHLLGHTQEFNDYTYHCTARDLTLAGPPQESIMKQVWQHNRVYNGFTPPKDMFINSQGTSTHS